MRFLRSAVEVLLDIDLPKLRLTRRKSKRIDRRLAGITEAIKVGRVQLAEDKRNMAAVLDVIRPVRLLGIVREFSGIAEFQPAFHDYLRGFEMAAAEGDTGTDEALADQCESDPRLSATEVLLLLESRAELSLRDLEATINGVIEIEVPLTSTNPRDASPPRSPEPGRESPVFSEVS